MANLTFPGQDKDENVIARIRRHWSVIFFHFFLFAIYFCVPIIVLFLLSNYLLLGIREFTYFPLIFLGLIIYYLIFWLLFFKGWIDYYLDVWIITNKRLIDVEQKGLFHHIVSELRLDKIQDVTVEVKGFLPSILHYGTINVQTAAAVQKFFLEDIGDPEKIKDLILDLHDQATQKRVVFEEMAPRKPA